MKKKSRVEILRGKLRRMGESDAIHPAMPEDVAEAFLAHVRFDPCVGPIAARDWSPEHRNEQPWIKGLLDSQPRLHTVEQVEQYVAAHSRARNRFGDDEDEAVN